MPNLTLGQFSALAAHHRRVSLRNSLLERVGSSRLLEVGHLRRERCLRGVRRVMTQRMNRRCSRSVHRCRSKGEPEIRSEMISHSRNVLETYTRVTDYLRLLSGSR